MGRTTANGREGLTVDVLAGETAGAGRACRPRGRNRCCCPTRGERPWSNICRGEWSLLSAYGALFAEEHKY